MIRLTIPSAGKALHLFLVNHFHSQLPRLVELGTRIGSRDNIICFLAHRTGDFSAGIFDHLLGFIAGVVSQGSREDEALAGQLRAADQRLRHWAIWALKNLGTKEARALLWQARSYTFESPSALGGSLTIISMDMLIHGQVETSSGCNLP